MLKLVTHKLIPKTVRKTLRDAKNIRCASSKDGKDSSLCADSPPQPPPCCPPVDPPPCPPPPPPCGPPCPPPCVPPCPPPIYSYIPDPNNPCNYCPPENPDPDEPDMTKTKKRQCLFQQDDGIPIYLKGGKHNVYLFHFITIIGGISFLQTMYFLLKEASK